jgi:STIP1 family protein 1
VIYHRISDHPAMSFELKEKGNQLFKEGDYNGAEELYSQA